MSKPSLHLLEFGRFRLDRSERLLFQDGAPVSLPPKLFDTLLILVENRGHVVEKDDLMQKIWADVAVEENNLAQNISALRKILGDSLADPKFIETIPKRGYRFVAVVEEVSEGEAGDHRQVVASLNDVDLRGNEPSRGVDTRKRSLPITPAIGVATVLVVLIGLFVMWRVWLGWGKQSQLKETQLTTNSSEASVTAVAISPDDKYLAYADSSGLYVRVVRTGETHPIFVPSASVIGGLSWFPDGTRLLATLTGLQPNVDTIWVLSILGQAPVKLLDGGSQAAVSPDGSQIVFARGKGKEFWLMAANGESPHRILAAGEKENLVSPVWGWDGKHLAYGRVFSDLDKFGTIVETLDLETGRVTVSFSDPDVTSGVTLPDGRIVYSRNEVSSGQSGVSLMECNTDPRSGKLIGKPRQIARWAGSSISSLGVTSDGKHLVALRGLAQADVYLGDVVDHRLENPHRLTFNDRDDFPSDWTPDSRYVLLASNRNGSMDIFRQGLNERTAEPLVTGPEDKLSLHLSPDGRWLLYFAFPGGYSQTKAPLLMRAPLSGGPPQFVFKARPAADFRCLKAPATMCVLSEWENQQLVFYVLDPVGGKEQELARQEIASGPDVVESRWDLSPDGSRIAVALLEGPSAGIRILSVTGGAPEDIVVAGWSAFQSIEWAADGKGWYVASRSAAANSLLFVDPRGHAFPLRQNPSGYDTYAVPSPDGHHLAFLEYTIANNAWMIENF
jgi:DNA-binding winged helix-turn-helix (wHTH) protein/Tol biopolymer transport system component